MVDLSITNIIELLTQVLVSIIIAVVIVIPAFFIWNYFNKKKIQKRVPIELKQEVMKGGKNGIKFIKKEQNRGEYPTADTDFLRRYSERRFFARGGETIDNTRRIESNIIKEQLASPSDSDITGNKSKYDWN